MYSTEPRHRKASYLTTDFCDAYGLCKKITKNEDTAIIEAMLSSIDAIDNSAFLDLANNDNDAFRFHKTSTIDSLTIAVASVQLSYDQALGDTVPEKYKPDICDGIVCKLLLYIEDNINPELENIELHISKDYESSSIILLNGPLGDLSVRARIIHDPNIVDSFVSLGKCGMDIHGSEIIVEPLKGKNFQEIKWLRIYFYQNDKHTGSHTYKILSTLEK